MKTYRIQFWAKFRGRVDVTIFAKSHNTAEEIAKRAWESAVDQYGAQWFFPWYDRKEMVCVGIECDGRQVTK